MSNTQLTLANDKLDAGPLASRWLKIGLLVGVLGLGLSAFLGFSAGDHYRHFFHSYLINFVFFLTLTLGALFFVTLQHLTKAGWSVVVRRLAELLAGTAPLLAVLALVVVVPAWLGNNQLFLWADAELVHNDHILHGKASYLNMEFFAVRCVIYFGFWALLSRFFLKNSTAQDHDGDANRTSRMQKFSAPSMVFFALTLSFAAFDFVMSLDPYWFSTIFGVYLFAGCVISIFAVLPLLAMYLQKQGLVATVISTEHYHDLGKFLFAFVFFWGYIAFSQFMLIWYGNIPEETVWFAHRIDGSWLTLLVVILFGHLLVPFGGLLSRHIKRKKGTLAFWALWMLAMHWLDLYWLIMPNFKHGSGELPFSWLDLSCFVGIAGFYIAGLSLRAKGRSLVAKNDPRLAESLAFENI